jgi:hypothetical protein
MNKKKQINNETITEKPFLLRIFLDWSGKETKEHAEAGRDQDELDASRNDLGRVAIV